MYMATVARKSIPIINDAVLSLFLLNRMRAVPLYAEASCEAISSIMDMTASHSLMSRNVSGICTCHSSSMRYWILVVSPSCVSSSIVTGFRVTFAKAQAIALDNRQPRTLWVFGSFLVSSQSAWKMWFSS